MSAPKGPDRFQSYEDLEVEMSDWLADEEKQGSKGGRAAALGRAEKEVRGDLEYIDWDDRFGDHDRGQLLAQVKNFKTKQTGKGNGKGKSQVRKCFECDSIFQYGRPEWPQQAWSAYPSLDTPQATR